MTVDESNAMFSSELINMSIMTTLDEMRARQGVCPKCKTLGLQSLVRSDTTDFNQCVNCKTLVVLGE